MKNKMKLSIIVPCYNEIATIGQVVAKIRSLDQPLQREIVIVDDYSKDGTRDYIKTWENDSDIKI